MTRGCLAGCGAAAICSGPRRALVCPERLGGRPLPDWWRAVAVCGGRRSGSPPDWGAGRQGHPKTGRPSARAGFPLSTARPADRVAPKLEAGRPHPLLVRVTPGGRTGNRGADRRRRRPGDVAGAVGVRDGSDGPHARCHPPTPPFPGFPLLALETCGSTPPPRSAVGHGDAPGGAAGSRPGIHGAGWAHHAVAAAVCRRQFSGRVTPPS